MAIAVYFDLDNTLVNRALSIDSFATLFAQVYGAKLLKVSISEISGIVKKADNGGYLASDSKYKKISEAIAFELSSKLPWREKISEAEIHEFWKTRFPQCTVEMAGAADVVNHFAKHGVHLGIISNGAEPSRLATLAATSFADRFKQVVSSGAFGTKKPDPEIFVQTAIAAGFEPSDCYYIGDHPVNDVDGALAAGMKAIWLSGFHQQDGVLPEAQVITALVEILPLIEARPQ
ncbi:HAD family hydrolase [Veronia pacifica]|uniref:Hydrolase n=1 Tax=Veronia pacifica TaxID=1080227 RepID=A0A1C3EAK7_9GAMM|nr:HAD family hydrolase [Veronia pacifica]ODA30240.1 hypothetical protein A8L45_20780 [Veronia pacifica]